MSDADLMKALGTSAATQTRLLAQPEVVLAEYPITSTELHKIANGDCCVLNARDSPFSLRFLLKHSQKSHRSSFVINRYVIQLVATETGKFMRKEDIAVRTKIVKTASKRVIKEKKKKEEVKVNIEDSNQSLF